MDQQWVPQWVVTANDFSLLESPLPMRFTPQEGVDFPFFSGFENAPTPRRRRKRGTSLWWMNGAMPLPILDAIIQEGVPVGLTSVDPPLRAWMKRGRDEKFHTLHQFVGPALVPLNATSFPDNVCRLMSEIQFLMLEHTIDLGMTWQLWTEAEIRQAISNRLKRFLADTGFVRERRTLAGVSGVSTYDLTQDIIQIRRVVWNTGTARVTLAQIDTFALDNGDPGWQTTTGTPYAYIEGAAGPGTLQVVPTPNASGTIEMVVVPLPDEIVGCLNIPIPAMFVPYLKYGVLADMLGKEGEANDPKRAEYCESRWLEGIELAHAFLGLEK
jgi:hypothetical protein